MTPRVLLFDIDGTLVLSGGAGLRAMSRAFDDLFAVADALRDIPMPGRTDAMILADAAAAHGVAAADLLRFPDAYLQHLAVEIEKPGPKKGVMPGVRELLDELAGRPTPYLSLLTGNYEQTARLKLEYFDLWRYFRSGAFGDGAADRNHLLPKALARIRAEGGPAATAAETFVIGDTPLDVACAQAAGARSLAVATGAYDTATLAACGADVVFEDLSDTPKVLAALGL